MTKTSYVRWSDHQGASEAMELTVMLSLLAWVIPRYPVVG